MISLAAVPPPVEKGSSSAFLGFMIVWTALGLFSFLFFHFNRNAALKRKVWPAFVILLNVVFGGFMYYWIGRHQPETLFVFGPALLLFTFLNLRKTRFCTACGRTLYHQPVFERTQFCPHCGGELK